MPRQNEQSISVRKGCVWKSTVGNEKSNIGAFRPFQVSWSGLDGMRLLVRRHSQGLASSRKFDNTQPRFK